MSENENLALIAGCRTPLCKAGSDLRGASAADLASHVFRELLDRTGIDTGSIDEVILGCAGQDSREANTARVAALRAGVPQHVPAVTVMRNCASGLEAILAAEMRMRAGDGEIFLVGGSESMSNYPLLMGKRLVGFFERMMKAKSPLQRLGAIASFRPSMLKPRIAITEGLTDPISGLIMGLTAENVARKFGVTREQQDAFAVASHQRAAAARESGRFEAEIAPMSAPPKFASMIEQDNGIRADQSLEALGKLRPYFDRREGDVTVGNACQITDGAAAMLVMSTSRAQALGLQPLAIIRSQARAGLDPAYMGLGPTFATPKALERAGIPFDAIDLWEINEAFAAQVLGCQAAFASDAFCKDELGLAGALGEIDPATLNRNGGAIALGHPIAASGARIALTLAEELRHQGKQYGVATLCIGGGQGQAIVLENAA